MALQHAFYEAVIAIGSQGDFIVPPKVQQSFDIGDRFQPALEEKTVVAAWYEPVDGIDQLTRFKTIKVDKATPHLDDVLLTIRGSDNDDASAAQVGIRVHALFDDGKS